MEKSFLNKYNIVYTTDEGFFKQMLVSIASVLQHKPEELMITFYIISPNLHPESKDLLIRTITNYGGVVKFLPAPTISSSIKYDRGSVTQYYRLFFDQIFRDIEIERALFLDADTMVTSSEIFDLFDTDFEGNLIGACLDAWSPWYRKVLGLNNNARMFNAGILLINIKKWKSEKISVKLEEKMLTSKTLFQADQGLLNQFFNGNFLVLNPKYNVVSSYFAFSYKELNLYRKPIQFYNQDKVESAVDSPAIVHFTSLFLMSRPWQKGSEHPFALSWRKNALSLGVLESVSKNKVKVSLLKKINKIFPRVITVRLFGILQAYGRPFLQIVKRKIKE